MGKIILLGGVCLLLMSAGWRTDFDKARADAKRDHKLILLKFSGSDWCLSCIKMDNEVFAKETFSNFAAANLELVNADFPRTKKNQVERSIAEQNDALANRYNSDGHFPYVVLLDAEGKVLKTWDGYSGEKPETFIQQIKPYAGTH